MLSKVGKNRTMTYWQSLKVTASLAIRLLIFWKVFYYFTNAVNLVYDLGYTNVRISEILK